MTFENLSVMANPLNLEDIAKLAGVSKTTVSSVLNGKADKYRISKATQAKVLAVAEQNNYQPNHSAAALRRGKSHSVGFIVPDFENRSYLRIAARLEKLARHNGFQLIIASSDDNPENEKQAAQMLISRGVDALLVSTCLNDFTPYRRFLAAGTPIISLDRAMTEEFSNVISDDRQGARALTQALALKDTTSVCLIGAMKDLEISQLRQAGFYDALKNTPEIKGRCFYGEHFDAASGAAAFAQALKAHNGLPPALICTSYSLLEGVIETLQRDFREVFSIQPTPIQLATFGNSRLLDFLPIPVVSLPQQYEQIAESSWMLVQQAIENSYQPQKIVIRRKLLHHLR
ncbi:MAG: LacI family fructose operon transcriptional repressor [Reinekea sp.]|jgi:LacI family fructose operon transcriptional repressor